MKNLANIPTPGPDATTWRKVTPYGHGHLRYFDSGRRVQFAYPDGHTWSMRVDT